jgi:hypothetical protein
LNSAGSVDKNGLAVCGEADPGGSCNLQAMDVMNCGYMLADVSAISAGST